MSHKYPRFFRITAGELEKSFEEAEVADLCLAMGSSLTVTPAANIPEVNIFRSSSSSSSLSVVPVFQRVALRHQLLVIVNLQRTPLDDLASLRINGKCDDVIVMLMKKLQLDIPEFRLKRLNNTYAA